jgi:serine/threonine-protein kinase
VSNDAPILPPDWHELEGLVDTILDAPPARRAALIGQLAGGSAARAETLRAMVEDCERGLPLLDRPATERFRHLADEPDSLLPAVVAERYRTGRELGRGGMARVYLAHDVKHGRDVAIKVLRPELSQSLGHDRFLREIEIAARLRHPNIVPLYDSGEIGGVLYFVMPCEEGPSLRERLRAEGHLPVDEGLGILRDVARALAYAHEHGVVHRDVKSDNVMLSSDAAVVTDFGIAKAVSAALTDAGGTDITQTGSAIGTPAYMAPEQASGDPATDHRADIYAFGCLAYEVFTGNPPFHSLSKHQVIASHLMTVPPAVSETRPEVPASVAALIARCLEKDPAARPQTAREVLRALDVPASTGAWPTPAAKPRPRRTVVVAGLALAAFIAATVFSTGSSRRTARPISLAVLPFGLSTSDSAMDYVADGLADEVAGALSRVPGIEIRSRSGARLYRRQLSVDVKEAGARLNADYVLHAVIRQERARWIVSADLARASDGTSIWVENFHISPDEAAGATDTIAASVIAALRRRFPDAVGVAPILESNQRTANPDAWRLFLRGEELLKRRGRSVRESAELFREAIRLDSRFARAHAGLSMALAFSPYFQGVPPSEVRAEAVASAMRALELDSTLAAPHTALGILHQFYLQWDRAEREHEIATRLEPRNVEARIQSARHDLMRGRPKEALRKLRAARAEDPASAVILIWSSYAYYLTGRMDSALADSRRAFETDPFNAPTLQNRALIMLTHGYADSARKLMELVPTQVPLTIYVTAKSGDTTEARRQLMALDAEGPQPWLVETRRALGYLGLGDTSAALTALERAAERGEVWSSVPYVSDPIYDPIRNSPRYRELVRRLGLADALAAPARGTAPR